MVRLPDPMRLRAHQARFDVARLSREGLDPFDASRLDALLDRPYEDLSGSDVACALDVAQATTIEVDTPDGPGSFRLS